jgi:hypothetical protein
VLECAKVCGSVWECKGIRVCTSDDFTNCPQEIKLHQKYLRMKEKYNTFP